MSEGALSTHATATIPLTAANSALLQRKCDCGTHTSGGGECTECGKNKLKLRRKPLQPATIDSLQSEVPPVVHEVLRSPGQSLDANTRAFFEPPFGHDFSQVRVHTDTKAAESARAVHARAYTVGTHIAFAEGEFAPESSTGRTLLGHELVHVTQQAGRMSGRESVRQAAADEEVDAQLLGQRVGNGASIPPQAVCRAPLRLAKAEALYVSPYNEALAAELLERLRQLRIAQGGASVVAQSKRVGAVAAVFDRQGNRIDTIEHMNVPGGPHAEELVVQDIRHRIAAGQKIEYTVLIVDQDPCPGTCSPLLKQWRGKPTSGTLRVASPMAASKRDPGQMVSAKTAYKRGLTQEKVPFEPRTLPPDNAAFIASRKDLSRVRLPLYKEASPSPATGGASEVSAEVTTETAAVAAKTLRESERQAAEQALEKAGAARVSKLTTQTAEKDLAETATEAFTKSATSVATRRLGEAAVPVIGAAFAAPDVWKGVQDLAHGDFVTGLGGIGVAIIDVASQGLHFTDEITAGGGSILAITIQTWAATMQFGFETARIKQRGSELKAYMKAHGNRLPPRDDLTSYYGLNDEDILILKNDIYKAQQNKVTTEGLANHVQALLAQIDADADKPLPEGVTPEGIQKERTSLNNLLVALKADVQRKRAWAAKEREATEEKRRQENFVRAQQRQRQPASEPSPRLLPSPSRSRVPQQQRATADPFNILSPQGAQPLNRISMENAELVATGFGRARNDLLARYQQLEARQFPTDEVTKYQAAVAQYINHLVITIQVFMRKGSEEWQGVKEMRRLRDAADNEDRSKLMR